MRYEEFEKKVQKKQKTWRFFYRFRIPLILVGAAIVISAASLTGTRGLVTDEETVQAQYVFGQGLSYRSSSFLSNVIYEFAPSGSENWSTEVPYRVGKYQMRSKAENSFASYYYGATQEFEILPMEIEVSAKEDSLTYGASPSLEVALPFGDALDENYAFDISGDLEKETWTYTPNLASLKAYSSSGEDVSDCYVFVPKEKNIQILRRNLTITSSSASKVYDGNALSEEGYTLLSGELVPGDRIVASGSVSLINVGKADNAKEYAVLDQEGRDMSAHYNIETSAGELTILKRPIVFSSPDREFVYDGSDHHFALDEVAYDSSSLVEGHHLEITLESEEVWIKPGEYQNKYSVKILSGETDVSSNYSLNCSFGKTVISPRPLSFATAEEEVEYDGLAHSKKSYQIDEGSLAETDELSLAFKEFINAGKYANEATFTITDKETGEDRKNCYEIDASFGNFVISKRPITVAIDPMKVGYDGKSHSVSCHIKDGTLVEGDKLNIVKNVVKTDVGVYDGSALKVAITDKEGLNVDANYDVTIEPCAEALTIEARALKAAVRDKSKRYDGKSIVSTLPENDIAYDILEGSLAENEYLTFHYENDRTNAGKETIVASWDIRHQVGEKPDAKVDASVLTNYDFTPVDGEFEVEKRQITIRTLDTSHVYNRVLALPEEAKTFEVVDGLGDGLVEGDYIDALDVSVDSVKAGKHPYLLDEESLVIKDAAGNDVTENYAPTFANTGALIIERKAVSIKIGSKEKIYDGKPIDVPYTQVGLLEGDKLTFGKDTAITHVKEGPVVSIPTKIYAWNGEEDVSENYDFTVTEMGALKVNPRPITIESKTFKRVYNGKELEKDKTIAFKNDTSLAPGDHFSIVSFCSYDNTYFDAIDKAINAFEVKVLNPQEEDVTDDYDITYKFGTITIEKREMTVSSTALKATYTGKAIDKGGDVVVTKDSKYGLGENDQIVIDSLSSRDSDFFHAGEYDNAYSIHILHGEERDVTGNYDLTLKKEKITIEACKITFGAYATAILYDGEEHGFTYSDADIGSASEKIFILQGSLPEGFTMDATLSVAVMKEVGIYEPELSGFALNYDPGEIVYAEGDIVYTVASNQQIVARPLAIYTVSGGKIYDGTPFADGIDPSELWWIGDGSLAPGDHIASYSFDPIVEIGFHTMVMKDLVIEDADGNDVTKNYAITYNCGGVTIYEV